METRYTLDMIRMSLSLLLMFAPLAPAFGENLQLSLRILDVQGPRKVAASGTAGFEIKIKNTGTVGWDPEKGFALGAHWLRPDGKVLKWDGPRTRLPSTIMPGDILEIHAICEAPESPGPALLSWDIVEEGLQWVSRAMERPPPPLPVEILRGPGFSLEHAAPLGWALAGSTREIKLEIRNTGGSAWQLGEGLAIAAHWETPDGGRKVFDGVRSSIDHEVAPGETLKLRALLEIPKNPGRWMLRWDMVREGHYWFSEKMQQELPAMLVVVLPSCAEAWPALLTTGVLFLFLIGFRRSWWPGAWGAEHIDLIWLTLIPLLIELQVLPGPEPWWISFCLLLVLAISVDLFPFRIRPAFSFSIGALFISLFLIDRIYLRFFGDLPSLGATALLGQGDEISASIGSLARPADMALALCIPLGILLVFFQSKPTTTALLKGRILRALMATGAGLLLLFSLQQLPAVSQVFRRAQVAENTGVAAAHLLDIGSWIRRNLLRPHLSKQVLRKITGYFAQSSANRRGLPPFFGAGAGDNLVLIQVESLQEFMVDLDIKGEPVMPTLRRWAAEGVLFTESTDETGQGRSSDAELLTQVSLLPLPNGAASFSCAGNHFVSLAGEAVKHGYTTLSAVPFDGSFWNRRRIHRDYGYQQSLFAEDFKPGRVIGWGLNDRDFLSQMAENLNNLPQPFLAWIITLSLHHPFEGFPNDLQELDVGHWEGSPVGEYIHTMHYLDHALADFEREMRSSGLWNHTIIMLWGDHDAGFRWTPEIAGLMGVSPDDLGWYRSQKIPILLHLPPTAPSLNSIPSTRPAGHADIAPTAAALLGIDPATLPWLGRNLLGNPGNEPIIGEYGCFSDREHIFLQGEDGRLESGRCYERGSLEHLALKPCAAAFQRARRIERISRTVLEEDLQEKIRDRMRSHK